jgi:Leucine-rich repeat (LRR) protein
MNKLEWLTVKNMKIDKISYFLNLENLTYLDLSSNLIKSLDGISGLTELSTLKLYNNQITSCEPLKNLTSLTYLDLQNNALDGGSKYGEDKQGNLDILANLNSNKNGSLTNLYLKGNVDLTNFISSHEILTLKWSSTVW